MGIVVFGFIIYFGYTAQALRWQPFAWLAALSIPATLFKHFTIQHARNSMGESSDGLWDPANIIVTAAANLAVWSVFYLAAFGVGRWRRRRHSSQPE